MKEPSLAQRETAKRMMACEGRSEPDPAAAAARVHAKLDLHLSPLVGSAGVHALFGRCLRRATGADHFLAQGDLSAGPASELGSRLRACLEEQPPGAAAAAAESLFASFIALLATLIGERLTAQVLANAWPELREPDSQENK